MNLIQSGKGNVRKIWHSLNELMPNDMNSLPTQLLEGKQILTEPMVVANTFNQYFSSNSKKYCFPSDINNPDYVRLSEHVQKCINPDTQLRM